MVLCNYIWQKKTAARATYINIIGVAPFSSALTGHMRIEIATEIGH